MLWKLSECIKNRFYAKSYTSRPHIPKIAVKLSKMAPPDRIKYRGSLTIPTVAKGLKEEIDVEEQNLKSFNKNTEILEVFSSQTDDLLGNNTSITLTSVRSF